MTDGLDPDTDVELLARALLAVLWEAGRLVLSDPDEYPVERIVSFARSTVNRYLAPAN